MKLQDREILVLGAFLHDIGKFLWRSQELKEGDNHEKLGAEFIRENLGKVSILQEDIEKIIDKANRLDGKIKRSDSTAASDRIREISTQTRRPLISIFSKIDIGKSNNDYFKSGVYYYNPVIPDEVIKPSFVPAVSTESWKVDDKHFIEKHKVLLDKFIEEIKSIRQINDFESFFTTFYHLCEKYTSFISSASYKTTPDISLFDHSRNVSGLSLCLKECDSDKECLMIKGDLSGIQNFLYNEIEEADKAAKQLRGRSFYISLLTELISKYLLRKFNCYETNLLFCSGGHFVLIVPNNKANNELYIELEKKINLSLLDLLEDRIQCVLSKIECSASHLFVDFPNVYNQLEKNSQREKKRKSLSIIDKLFQERDYDSSASFERKIEILFEKIGEKLPYSKYLIEVDSEDKLRGKIESLISFSDFNKSYILSPENELENNIGLLKDYKINRIKIIKLGDSDFLKYKYVSENVINQGFDYPISRAFWFISSQIPFDGHTPYSFEEIATFSNELSNGEPKELCYPTLGIIRMDVDSLGLIFSEGLKEDKSVSRISTLSRLIGQFFSYSVNTIAKRHFIYLVYSGGDDLLAVGSWKKIIDFAIDLRKSFKEFTCNNPNITLSAGTIFVRDNFPISKGALLAGEKEDDAKNNENKSKDSISLFEREVKWDELDGLMLIAEAIDKTMNYGQADSKKTISRTFLYSLLEMTKELFDKKGKFNIDYANRITHKLAYQFARNGVNAEEIEKKTLGFKTDLANYFLKKQTKELQKWYYNFQIPASYVLLKTRKINK